MSGELTRYRDNLVFSSDTLGTIGIGLTVSQKYLGQMEKALKKVQKAMDKFDTMDNLAENLAKTLKVLKFFPPLKNVVKIVEKGVQSFRDGSGTFLESMADIEQTLGEYLEAIGKTKSNLGQIGKSLSLLDKQIGSVIPGIDQIIDVVKIYPNSAPPSLAAILGDLDAKLAPINQAFDLLPKKQMIELNIKVAEFQSLLEKFKDFGGLFDQFADAFSAIYSKLKFLDKPLSWVMDAVDGFMYVLEWADKLIDKILDPILDPILKAAKVYDLIDLFVDKVKSVLPDYDLDLAGFKTFDGDLENLFGKIPLAGLDWEIPRLTAIKDLASDILSAFQGAIGYLGRLKETGGEGTDLMVGNKHSIAGTDVSKSEKFDGAGGRDVIVGGAKSDEIKGGAGDDLIVASAGDDSVDGGTGTGDIFASSASISDYSWRFSEANGHATFYFSYNGSDPNLLGQSTVTNVEYFMFGDTTYRAVDLLNVIKGIDGRKNVLNGTDGNDLIFGGNGVDLELPDMIGLNLGGSKSEYLFAQNIAMPTDEMTVEFLIQGDLPAGTNKIYTIMSYGVHNQTNEFTLFVTQDGDDGKYQLQLSVNGQLLNTAVDAAMFFDGKIHRFTLEWTSDGYNGNSYVHIYNDGEFVYNSRALTGGFSDPITSGGVLVFGQDQDGQVPGVASTFDPNQAFQGYLGDIRIFNSWRTSTEIYVDAFFPLKDPASQEHLVHYWDPNTAQTTGPDLGMYGVNSNDILRAPIQRIYQDIDQTADTINGLGGDDVITGFAGRDIIDGGAGIDTVDYSAEHQPRGVFANLDPTHISRTDPKNPQYFSHTDYLYNIENVVGSEFGDVIVGDNRNNKLNGRDGSDALYGRGGNDVLIGGDGHDYVLAGGTGDDTMMGGKGHDIYIAGLGQDRYIDTDLETSNMIFYSDEGSGFVSSYQGANDPEGLTQFPDHLELFADGLAQYRVKKFYSGVEDLDILNGHYSFWLSTGNDVIHTHNVISTINAMDGDDLFLGSEPLAGVIPDQVSNPILNGDSGNDRLVTYTGDENFNGHSGNDTVEIWINSQTDYAPNPSPSSRVQFSGHQGIDTLDLRKSDLNWVLQFNATQSSNDDLSGRLIGTQDITIGQSSNFMDLDVFDPWDDFGIAGFDRILGSNQTDTITIKNTDANSRLEADLEFSANAGDDYIDATRLTGNLTADMGAGDDVVKTGLGVDTVFGGDGNDQITVYGNDKNATEIFHAGEGNDLIVVEQPFSAQASYEFHGGNGRDVLDFKNIDNWILAIDFGTQSYRFNNGSIFGTFDGFEAVIGSVHQNSITGDEFDNILSGNKRGDTIRGGAGNDIIYGASTTIFLGHEKPDVFHRDELFGDEGNDLIYVEMGQTIVHGGEGIDRLQLSGRLEYSQAQGFETVHISGEVTSNWHVDMAKGLGTQTSVGADAGQGSLTGTIEFDGIEMIIGGLGHDYFAADLAGSNIDGSDGNDKIIGLSGHDTLAGGRGDDVIAGADGSDFINPGPGFNFVSGGDGMDVLDLRQGANGITKTTLLGSAIYNVDDFAPLQKNVLGSMVPSTVGFTGIETVHLSDFSDLWIASALDDTIRGNGGNDEIRGGGGADSIEGGAGNDHLLGGGDIARLPDMIVLNQSGSNNDFLMASQIALPANEMTLEFMINANVPQSGFEYALVSYGVEASTNELLLIVTDAGHKGKFTLTLFIGGNSYDTGLDVSLFLDGNDHRFSFARDQSQMKIYVDGGLLWGDTLPANFAKPLSGNGTLVFGQDQDGQTPGQSTSFQDHQAFVGSIGDIRIFKTVSDSQDIAKIAGHQITPAEYPDLEYSWQMDFAAKSVVNVLGPPLNVGGAQTFISGQTAGVDGENTLDGGAGHDTLVGGNANDILFDAFGDNVLNGGAGDDRLVALSGNNTLIGQDGNDAIQGGIQSDYVSGGLGNDVLRADVGKILFGNDTVDGGAGDDLLAAGDGADVFVFGVNAGTDVIAEFVFDPKIATAPPQSLERDFQAEVDVVRLVGFGYGSAADALAKLSDLNGTAVFSDQGTTITFFDVQSVDLTADNFVIA